MVSSDHQALATDANATYHLEVLSASPGPKIFQIKDLMTADETDHIIRVSKIRTLRRCMRNSRERMEIAGAERLKEHVAFRRVRSPTKARHSTPFTHLMTRHIPSLGSPFNTHLLLHLSSPCLVTLHSTPLHSTSSARAK